MARDLTFHTNHQTWRPQTWRLQTWRLAALGIIAGFAASVLALNNAGVALSILGMGMVAIVADRKLTDLTRRSLDSIRVLADTRSRLENSRRLLEQERTALQTAVS